MRACVRVFIGRAGIPDRWSFRGVQKYSGARAGWLLAGKFWNQLIANRRSRPEILPGAAVKPLQTGSSARDQTLR